MRIKIKLKITSENDAKKEAKRTPQGCQEGLKIDMLGANIDTKSDLSTHSVSQAILKRIFMKI